MGLLLILTVPALKAFADFVDSINVILFATVRALLLPRVCAYNLAPLALTCSWIPNMFPNRIFFIAEEALVHKERLFCIRKIGFHRIFRVFIYIVVMLHGFFLYVFKFKIMLPTFWALFSFIFGPKLWLYWFTYFTPLLRNETMGPRSGSKVVASLTCHHTYSIFIKSVYYLFRTENAIHHFNPYNVFWTEWNCTFCAIVILISINM